MAKTQAQKDNYFTKKDSKMKEEKCLRLMHNIYKQHGIMSLYSGWQFRSIQYFFQSIYTVSTLDYLERKAKEYI